MDEETTQQALEVIERNTGHRRSSIEDLLEVSRIIPQAARKSDNRRYERVIDAAIERCVWSPDADAKTFPSNSQRDNAPTGFGRCASLAAG
jgi:hypothetical protein